MGEPRLWWEAGVPYKIPILRSELDFFHYVIFVDVLLIFVFAVQHFVSHHFPEITSFLFQPA